MDIVRQIVSGKKKRYLEGGYNLDLTYITPRIIAMSLPGEGLHKVYRNSIDSVSKMLNSKHAGKYLVLNLSGVKYDYEKFRFSVKEFNWIDHYPPSIDVLFHACRDIHEWLVADRNNVIAVNCKAGKGRTGTLICCYMLFCGRFQDPIQALKYYKSKRFSKGGGVTQPSQIRYVMYFNDICLGRVKGPLIRELLRVHLRTIPHMSNNSSKLIFEIKADERILYSNKKGTRDKQTTFHDTWEDSTMHELTIINSDLRLQGDITCFLNHWGVLKVKHICRFSFNTAFIPASGEIVFDKTQLDPDNFRHNKKTAENFSVHMIFQNICECTADLELASRCNFCKINLSPLEMDKWQNIRHILVYKADVNPTITLFGALEADDVIEVMSIPVDDLEFSSDGSAT